MRTFWQVRSAVAGCQWTLLTSGTFWRVRSAIASGRCQHREPSDRFGPRDEYGQRRELSSAFGSRSGHRRRREPSVLAPGTFWRIRVTNSFAQADVGGLGVLHGVGPLHHPPPL